MSEQEDEWLSLEDEEQEGLEPGENLLPEERMRIQLGRSQELLRIDKFLMTRVEGATRNKIQHALENGLILVNGAQVKPNYRVRPLDEILVYETRRPESSEIIPEPIPLDIRFEDETVIVVNKPAGMVVHPGSGNYSGTLVNGLAWYLNGTGISESLPERVGLVHRIDKDTSGLLVVAKTQQAMHQLAAQFKKHTVHRKYIALVWGDFSEDEGTIEGNVGRNLRYRKIMDVFPEGDYGKRAVTHYRVLERYFYVTLLELKLETGRTHQIRVHMKYRGHPLFNDATYGGDRIVKGTVFSKYRQFVENCFSILPRQALHAKELGFAHPASGEWMQFDTDLPEPMQEVIQKWKEYTAHR